MLTWKISKMKPKAVIVFMFLLLTGGVYSKADLIIDGHLDIYNGDVYNTEVGVIGNGSLDMFGGYVHHLGISNFATANIYGGSIDWLWTFDYSVVNIHGGNIGIWESSGEPDGELYLYAYDVSILPAPEGQDYGTINGLYYQDNAPFSINYSRVDDLSNLHIVPEPATFLLLGSGLLLLRKIR